MGKTSHEGQQILGDTELANALILRLGQKRKEGDDLLAEAFASRLYDKPARKFSNQKPGLVFG